MCTHCLSPESITAADPATTGSEAFAERLVETLNSAALSLMLSIGHRSGLFDVMTELPSGTSAAVAEAAGLNERYVREWLGAMVAGGVVHYDRDSAHYRLPPEHGAWLSRKSPAENLAVLAQYIPVLGGVEDDVLHCFRHGGGVPYERYPRFHSVMEEDSGQSALSVLESDILPLVPGLVDRLEAGIRVLDIGCGRGRILNRLAERYPRSELVGYELSEEAVAYARETAAANGSGNLRFEVRDLTGFDASAEPQVFDLVTAFDAIHDQADPQGVLDGIRRSLRPDGVFLMQDIHGSSDPANNVEHPIGTLLYTISCLHCMTVSLAQGGAGLGAMWGEELAIEMLQRAGFASIDVRRLDHDIQNDYYVCGA